MLSKPCHPLPALSAKHLSINKLHFGMNRRFKMDSCHPPSLSLNSYEHMQRLCCSFLGLYDGTFNCTKSATDGKRVTDWIGSAADAQGHSTRTTHYFKLPPWGETIVYVRMKLFLWHLIFQFHPKGHLCFLTDNISQLEPASLSYNDSISMSNVIHICEECYCCFHPF